MNIQNQTETMTSLEIAEETGKLHKHVLEAIRSMEPAWEKIAGSKFRPGSYIDANQQNRPCYELTKTECLFVATKFNDEARAKLVLRWEELENKQLSRKQLILMALEAEEERERLEIQNQIQAKELQKAAPKVDFYDKVLQSDSLMPITIIAKDLEMSAKSLNRLLYRLGIIYKTGGTWVLYSKYQNKGYARTRTHHYTNSKGEPDSAVHLYWTQKGREFIVDIVNGYKSKKTG